MSELGDVQGEPVLDAVINSPRRPPWISCRHPISFALAPLSWIVRARELRKSGLSTGVPEQSIKILALLLEKPGEVVLREEIRKKLWPNDTVVEFDPASMPPSSACVKRSATR